MKYLACILAFSLFLTGCASHQVRSDFYFLPCSAKASVSFEGETQAGRGVHRLEVRRLAYAFPPKGAGQPTMSSCVIYYAGDDYGPYILSVLDECVDPFVRRASKDVVEIYFLAGAHSHFRQRWKLLGSTAKLESQDAIEWSDDPRNQPEAQRHAGVPLAALPEFQSYPAALHTIKKFAATQVPKTGINWKVERYLKYSDKEPLNFADKYTLGEVGCGTGCVQYCLIDRVNGTVYPGEDFNQDFPNDYRGLSGLYYCRDSRLFIVYHADAFEYPVHVTYYVWEETKMKLLRTDEIQAPK